MSDPIQIDVIGSKQKAELPAELFDAQANIPLMHQVVVAQLAAARQGTHATKTRVSPWRWREALASEGHRSARHGSRRAPSGREESFTASAA